MTDAQVALTAALGASFLTAMGSWGVVWFQERLRGKASDRDALHAAVLELLTRSLAVATRAQAMGETMRLRSGLSEGLDVAVRLRKPVDPLELHDWVAQDLQPLHAALSQLWTRCDQEGVRLANDVVGKCMDLVGTSTASRPARNGWQRVVAWAVGERWTSEMREEHQRAMEALALARKRFTDYAREALGQAVVDVFAQVERPDGDGRRALSSQNSQGGRTGSRRDTAPPTT
ncbi:hypothetical protein ACQPXS_10045 [Streptomyces sp. CA-142005]|uniref:hypothetical protein n=1 Tax=Streptomyces sp. CA-142005 TaxID=3240052 RepID=UPI003D936161